MTIMAILAIVAVALTCTMFAAKQMLLGFPCAIFWAVLSGQAYDLSATEWDIYYFIFFSSIGMSIYCMYAMYALRAKDLKPKWDDEEKYYDEPRYKAKDPDRSGVMYEKEGGYIDEDNNDDFDDITKPRRPSRRVRDLHKRVADRRTGVSRESKRDWGEFK